MDVSAEGSAGLVGQPELQQPCVETEGFLRGQAGVEAGRREFRLLGGRVEGGRVGQELVACRHQVLAHPGEGADVFALPEHDFISLLGGFVFRQTVQRRLEAEFDPAQGVADALVRKAEQDPRLLPDRHEKIGLIPEMPIDGPAGNPRLFGDFF